MGLWPGANYHDRRYELCEEYVQIMRALWRDGRVTHHGEFYQLEDCVCAPTAKREIPIVSAGQSAKGIAFTARHAEYNFVFGGNAKLKRIAAPLGAAAEAAGRQVGMLALVCIIAAATDQEAAERTADIVAGADKAAISGVSSRATSNENITAIATVRPNCRKYCPAMPPMKLTGAKTAMIVIEIAMTARPISSAASSEAR